MQIKRVSFVLAVFASAFVAGCNKETPSAKSAVEPKRIRELEARMEHLETELKERTEYLDGATRMSGCLFPASLGVFYFFAKGLWFELPHGSATSQKVFGMQQPT